MKGSDLAQQKTKKPRARGIGLLIQDRTREAQSELDPLKQAKLFAATARFAREQCGDSWLRGAQGRSVLYGAIRNSAIFVTKGRQTRSLYKFIYPREEWREAAEADLDLPDVKVVRRL